MFKFKKILVVFLILGLQIHAQQYNTSIKLNAKQYITSIKNHDFKSVVTLTYSKYINIVGGKDTLLSRTSNDMIKMREEGLRYRKLMLGEPKKTHYYHNLIYTIIPLRVVKENSQGKILIDTYLFSVSKDEGLHWFFLNQKQFKDNKALLFPFLTKEFRVPEISSIYIKKSFNAFSKPN